MNVLNDSSSNGKRSRRKSRFSIKIYIDAIQSMYYHLTCNKMISLALRVLVVCLLVAIGHCQQILEPFTSVVVCANSDVGFQPSTDSSYSMVVQGNQELFDTVEVGTRRT